MNQSVERLVGKCIDMYLCSIAVALPGLIIYTFTEFNTVLHFCLCLFATILFIGLDALNLSLGKKIFKLHIDSTKGLENVSALRKIIRNLTLVIWPIEIIVLWKSKDHRRLGDIWANTVVKHTKRC